MIDGGLFTRDFLHKGILETEDNLVYPLLAAIGWADIDVQPNANQVRLKQPAPITVACVDSHPAAD